jgi:glutamate formiminotransferase
VLECVVNVSEGRRPEVVAALAAAAGADLLDVHTCGDHHRSVLTLVGEDAPRAVARAAVELLDLRHHTGAHPRIGVLDVVPFVPLNSTPMRAAIAARDEFAGWAAGTLGLPCFLYGPERSLPDIRRGAFTTLTPDVGPTAPHPSAGAVAVGARRLLVAYNLWLAESDLDAARRAASAVRSDAVRALGLAVGDQVQVSMNLIDPERVGPAAVWDLVAALAPVARAELVGLVPASVLDAVPSERWAQLDLGADRTIEARLAERARRSHQSGSDGGS